MGALRFQQIRDRDKSRWLELLIQEIRMDFGGDTYDHSVLSEVKEYLDRLIAEEITPRYPHRHLTTGIEGEGERTHLWIQRNGNTILRITVQQR